MQLERWFQISPDLYFLGVKDTARRVISEAVPSAVFSTRLLTAAAVTAVVNAEEINILSGYL